MRVATYGVLSTVVGDTDTHNKYKNGCHGWDKYKIQIFLWKSQAKGEKFVYGFVVLFMQCLSLTMNNIWGKLGKFLMKLFFKRIFQDLKKICHWYHRRI